MHDDDEPGETTPTTHPLSAQRVTARELIWIRRELHQVALALHGLSLWMVPSDRAVRRSVHRALGVRKVSRANGFVARPRSVVQRLAAVVKWLLPYLLAACSPASGSVSDGSNHARAEPTSPRRSPRSTRLPRKQSETDITGQAWPTRTQGNSQHCGHALSRSRPSSLCTASTAERTRRGVARWSSKLASSTCENTRRASRRTPRSERSGKARLARRVAAAMSSRSEVRPALER
jgi:hypothetical protein